MKKLILWFDEIGKKDVGIVGGKNANLGEMYHHLTAGDGKTFPKEKIKVPYGFAITAEAYRFFIRSNKLDHKIKQDLRGLNTRNIRDLEKRGQAVRDLILSAKFPTELAQQIITAYQKLAKHYRTTTAKLDVAVRSSATAEDLPNASFAGQQETYLNIRGENEVLESVKKGFASLFTNRAISYRHDTGFDHFNVALSVAVQKMVRSDRGSSGVMFTLDTESGFRDAIIINASYGLGEYVVAGIVNPDEFVIFKPSLARGFNAIISKKLGSKEKKLIYGIDGSKPTKEVLVSPADRQRFVLTEKHILQLARWGMIIENHYNRPMDIEWAYDGATQELYLLQARPETVEARKQQGVVLEEYRLQLSNKNGRSGKGGGREKPETGQGGAKSAKAAERSKNAAPKVLVRGVACGAKIGQGKVHFIKDASQIAEFKKGEVLVTEITDPDWEPIMKIAAAIVTDFGGRTSHAAIVSRELGIPAVVGCADATKILKTGKEVTVSCAEGEVGKVYEGLLPFKIERHDLKNFKPPKTEVKMIVADPELVFGFAQIPHRGVGLAREEFIISNYVKIHPNALINYKSIKDKALKKQIDDLTRGYSSKTGFYVEKLAYGIAMIAAAYYPYEVVLRFSDFKSNEYRNLIGGALYEPVEENPMLGWRGASRYYDPKFAQAFALECQAVKRVREDMGLWNLKVMIPFCRTPEEGRKVLEIMKRHGLPRAGHQAGRRTGRNFAGRDKADRTKGAMLKVKGRYDTVVLYSGLEVLVMAEVPSNVLQAEEFAKIFDAFSIGSNDLTQLTLGLDRDSGLIAHIGSERNASVKRLIHELILVAHKNGKKVGICGQGPSDFPDFGEFLVREGIDSISINPDTVLKATLKIKAVEQQLAKGQRQQDKKGVALL